MSCRRRRSRRHSSPARPARSPAHRGRRVRPRPGGVPWGSSCGTSCSWARRLCSETTQWRCCAISIASWASTTRTFLPTSACATRCGTGRRSRLLATLPRVVKDMLGLRHAWNALPDRTRTSARAHLRTLAHRLDQRTPAGHEGMDERPDPALIERLQQHFAPDVALVETLVGPVPGVTDLPWVGARRDGGSAGSSTEPAGPAPSS